jgi:hypothetical protein
MIGISKDSTIYRREKDMVFDHEERCQKIKKMIDEDPSVIPQVLRYCSDYMIAFEEQAKKKNDALLRESLGDACHLLGMKRKPSGKAFYDCCTRIVEAIFPNGIDTSYHHEGEKRFYRQKIEPWINKPESPGST